LAIRRTPRDARPGTDEFHEAEGVVYIPGVGGGEWIIPGLFPSWASLKRTTFFRRLISIRLEKKVRVERAVPGLIPRKPNEA
jgi:hypothetical protein